MVPTRDAPKRMRFTIGQVMVFIAAVAFLLAAVVVRHSAILALIAFFILTQFLLRVLIAAMPSLGSIFLGTRRPALTEEDAAEIRQCTRAAARLCQDGKYAEALEHLIQSESIHSGDVWNAIAQAWCLRKLGRLHESVEPLERAEFHASLEPLIPYALACHWSLIGDVPRALGSLSTALELDPELREC